MRCLSLLVIFIFMAAGSAKADQFCFASAETYYEQVYCQLQAKAQTKNLPPFFQFRKNPEPVQYSLLKRPAERNAIKLPAPAKKVAAVLSQAPSLVPTDNMVNKSLAPTIASNKPTSGARTVAPSTSVSHDCELHGKAIRCNGQVFYLIGNKANHRLIKDALSMDNKMALPVYQGGGLNIYLAEAYRQYIAKMLEIGLGGVTMSYRKFAYLYQDLHTKGLDFSQRFETMYMFLKKDKATMGVSESMSLPATFSASQCDALGERFYVCDTQGRNYIFAAL